MAVEEKLPPSRRTSSELGDVELALWQREVKRSSRRGVKVILSACLVTLVLFLFYVITPFHASHYAHRSMKHHGTTSERSKHVGTFHSFTKRSTNEADACTSPACVAYAKEIKTYLAPNYTAIDPCVDFDEYACGGWRQTHQYRPEQASVSTFSVMGDAIKDVLRSILDGEFTTHATGQAKIDDEDNFKKMKAVYQTCMNEDAIKAYGTKYVTAKLQEFDKVFPEQGPSFSGSSNEELTNILIWMGKNFATGLVSIDVDGDDKAPTVNILAFGSPGPKLPKQYWKKPAVVANYTRMLIDMAQVIEAGKPIYEITTPPEKLKAISDRVSKLVEIHRVMTEMTPDPEAQSETSYYYQPRTLAEMQKVVPEIDFIKYLKAFVPPAYPLTPDRMILNTDMYYFGNLSSFIQKRSRQDFHNLFRSSVTGAYSGRLHNNLTLPSRRFSNMLAGKDPDTLGPRWRTCLSEVDGTLGHILSAAYVARAFSSGDKALGDQIVNDLKSVFTKRIQKLDWMTEEVKKRAIQKVANIVQKIGYQTQRPNVIDPTEVRKYYAKLTITPNTSWHENSMIRDEFATNKSWNDLLKPVDKARWAMTASTVNAYYSPNHNEIVFPAGIMRKPIFSSEVPEYVSYGAWGMVVGHELTHGFDNLGSKFDMNGVLSEWWDEPTKKNFDNKTQCFVKQFEKYSVPGLDNEPVHINGKLTLGENIADTGGLVAAYQAWKEREATRPNPKLPGLENLTPDQMFFLSAAFWKCGKDRKEAVLSQVYTDPHSPDNVRTWGSSANAGAFRQAFNCPVKEPTCALW